MQIFPFLQNRKLPITLTKLNSNGREIIQAKGQLAHQLEFCEHFYSKKLTAQVSFRDFKKMYTPFTPFLFFEGYILFYKC